MGSLVLGLLSLVLMAPWGTPQDASPHSPSTQWYRGLIGSTATALENAARYEQNKEVELRLDFDGDRVTGRYFHVDTGRGRRGGNISLAGSRDARNAIRLEERGNAEGVTGVWAGVLEGDAFSGTWTDPTGRHTLRFFVRELANFDGEEQEAAPGLAFRARRVIGTNLALPFLTQHPQSRVLERVNGRIQAMFEDSRCSPASSFPGWPDDFHVDWKVTYASAELLSVAVSEERSCGAAYPSTDDRSFTFDLRTGDLVTFEGLFRDYGGNREAILTVLFADAIKGASAECQEVRSTQAAAVATETGGKGKPGLPLLSTSITFHLGEVSLVAAEADLVHAIRGCGAVATIPYEKLRRFAAPIISRIQASGPPEAPPSEPRTADLREDLRKVVADAAIDFRLGKGGRTASSDGHQSYESKLALRGCTDQAIWTRPDGEIEFTCQLFPPSKGREALYERLNRRVAAIIAVLPAGWEVQRYPAAQPYHPVVVARDPTGRVELTAHVTPFVDGTFAAGLSVTRKVPPAPDVPPPPRPEAQGSGLGFQPSLGDTRRSGPRWTSGSACVTARVGVGAGV